MCGFVGFFSPGGRSSSRDTIVRMADSIVHRGPDSCGYWADDAFGLVLGHRRLAVLELSEAGHQPMISPCERFVLVFNGEIYNHLELRRQLDGGKDSGRWRGHADTETLLACVADWGVEQTLNSAVGMFALALWDRERKVLTLARDRIGEKPLYYGWQGQTLLFASELKAFRCHPDFRREVDRDALTLLLRHNCIPAPFSIYRGICKLRPGHIVSLPLYDPVRARAVEASPYWRLSAVVEEGRANPFTGSDTEAIDLLEQQLARSIGDQMLSDVPLGAFLSGGVDSSTVVALMQSRSPGAVKTFTIGFDEGGYDEAVHARAVAKHLGTEHCELYVRPADALAVIPELPSIYCEPFSDSSQIPTFLVSRLARQRVTVALSGDGGDELFGGYNRYLTACKVWQRAQKWPRPVRHAAARALRALSPAAWDGLFRSISPALPSRFRLAMPGDKAHKLSDVLMVDHQQAFYRRLTSHWHDPADLVIDAHEPQTLLSTDSSFGVQGFEQWMMAMDAQTYLPDDILVKVDRAAMANSLETRVPMLDHRVVELAWRMPMRLKIRDGQGKWLLRQVLYRHVPAGLIERPKMGFGVPIDSWLRGPLRDWAEELIGERRLKDEGFLRSAPIRRMWKEHLEGRRNWQHHLWDVLMFQAWLEEERR